MTFVRLAPYLPHACGIAAIQRSRIHELLQAEGLRWREQETWFGAQVDPAAGTFSVICQQPGVADCTIETGT